MMTWQKGFNQTSCLLRSNGDQIAVQLGLCSPHRKRPNRSIDLSGPPESRFSALLLLQSALMTLHHPLRGSPSLLLFSHPLLDSAIPLSSIPCHRRWVSIGKVQTYSRGLISRPLHDFGIDCSITDVLSKGKSMIGLHSKSTSDNI